MATRKVATKKKAASKPARPSSKKTDLVKVADFAIKNNPANQAQAAAMAVIDELGKRAYNDKKNRTVLVPFLLDAFREAKRGGGSGGDDPDWSNIEPPKGSRS